ncbi:Ovarian-specific serine/threonine-protein kinase Lok [Tetrabaena socialis]|uniref:Ovarian-specific serine/threonine-protein kinase Lok n=1 Tax=Tetrabaena socialis TaxID=47790 RepID=A0A2J7ZJ37_9CHLO|nr:Ovarian-specific serine/threonine-protein kinase Lok [Tetrabaena socialis]|eukprot:PNH00285.1 Ovarian-specific serine/threonine-protein kinase Lok [Tetrabaena socialis]
MGSPGSGEIGSGSFGKIHRIVDDDDFVEKRMKIVNNDGNVNSNNVTDATIACFLKRHKLPGFIQIEDITMTSPHDIAIKMPFAPYGDLDAWIRKTIFTERMSVLPRIYNQLSEALSQLHAHGMIHGDIKPKNVLVTDARPATFTVKVADFGSGRFFRHQVIVPHKDDAYLRVCSTITYAAPEIFAVFEGSRLDDRVDAYSLGALLHYCIFKKTVIDERDIIMAGLLGIVRYLRIVHKKGKIADPIRQKAPKGVPEGVYDDMVKLMRPNPRDRATITSLYSPRLKLQVPKSFERPARTFTLDAPDVMHWGSQRERAIDGFYVIAQRLQKLGSFALAVNIADRFVYQTKRPCTDDEMVDIMRIACCLVDVVPDVSDVSDVRSILTVLNFEMYSQTCDVILREFYGIDIQYSLIKRVLRVSNGSTTDACHLYMLQCNP